MMNNKDKGIDLGLTLSNSHGAGANATSRIDMASSSPLSELVWSPNNGCVDSGLVHDKPFLLWNVTPSITTQSIRSCGSEDEKVFNEENMTISPKMLDGNKYNSHFGPPIVQTVQSSKKHADEPLVCSPEDSQSWKESEDEVTSPSGKVIKHKTSVSIPIPASVLTKLDPGAENDSDHIGVEEAKDPCEMRILYREKGKGKALSNEDIYQIRSSSEEHESHESAESCNNVRFPTTGVKRGRNDQVGSKRTKNYRHDSSFMNWISNMVKGHSDQNQKDNFKSNGTHNTKRPTTGFRSMFQSLFCPNTKKRKTVEEPKQLVVVDEKYKDNSCKQIILSNKEGNQNISRKFVDSSRKEVNINDQKNTNLGIPIEKSCVPGKKNCKRITEEARGCSTLSPKISEPRDDSAKEIQNFTADASVDLKSSETIASVFAKEMDALKDIMDPENHVN